MMMMMTVVVVVVVVVVMLVRVVKTAEQAKSDINSPRINKCSPLGPKRIPFVSLNTRRRRFCCQPKLVYFATFFLFLPEFQPSRTYPKLVGPCITLQQQPRFPYLSLSSV